MTEDMIMAFVERFNAIIANLELDRTDEIFAPEFVGHLPLAQALDREAWKSYFRSFSIAVSNLVQEVNEVLIDDGRLVLRVTYTGTHSGWLFGIAPTGVPVTVEVMIICRFNTQGLVAETWVVADVIGLLVQIRSATTRYLVSNRGQFPTAGSRLERNP